MFEGFLFLTNQLISQIKGSKDETNPMVRLLLGISYNTLKTLLVRLVAIQRFKGDIKKLVQYKESAFL